MNKKKFAVLMLLLISLIILPLIFKDLVFAATSPSLGQAGSFGILGSTYTNTVGGTTINGDLGYTTGPATTPTVNGTTHIADSTYTQAGTAQGNALSGLNSQPCNFNYGSATDLSLLSQPLSAGVYCVTGAMSIGTGGITLSGSSTYIFRSTGALTTVANSSVSLSNGASECNVFWTPGEATTLAANSTFAGTNIDDSGISIGSNITWIGRALAFGGTVSTDTDTITQPTCQTASPSPTATSLATSSPTPTSTATTTGSPQSLPTSSPETIQNDVCTNIEGIQTSVPEGWFQVGEGSTLCRQFELGGAPASQGGNGTVSGASAIPGKGQVLGSSTMGKTGSFDGVFYQVIMGVGATLSTFGLKGFQKGKKVSKK